MHSWLPRVLLHRSRVQQFHGIDMHILINVAGKFEFEFILFFARVSGDCFLRQSRFCMLSNALHPSLEIIVSLLLSRIIPHDSYSPSSKSFGFLASLGEVLKQYLRLLPDFSTPFIFPALWEHCQDRTSPIACGLRQLIKKSGKPEETAYERREWSYASRTSTPFPSLAQVL